MSDDTDPGTDSTPDDGASTAESDGDVAPDTGDVPAPDDDAEGDPTPEGEPSPGSGGWNRRTLVKILLAVAFGIPILVELSTFLGLIDTRLLGGEGGDGTTAATTTTGRRVSVGDELLPETTPRESVTDAYVSTDTWTFVLRVEVENTGDVPYELNLTGVATAEGTRVAMDASTDRIRPGETATVTGRVEIPQGEQPDAVRVVAVSFADGTRTASSVARDVPLSRVPLRG